MTFDEARGHIIACIDEVSITLDQPRIALRLRDASQEITFQELELDSLAAMEMCIALEDCAGIEIEPADLVLHRGINSLAKFIATQAPN